METGDQYGPALPSGNANTGSETVSLGVADFGNQASFNSLLALPDTQFYPWLSSAGLIGSSDTFKCPTCGGDCKFVPRANRRLCFTFRCRNSKNHEFSLTRLSIFEKVKIDIRILLKIVRSYLLGCDQDQCVLDSGLGNTKTDWTCFIRDIFVESVMRSLNSVRFYGQVEINDCLVGTITQDHATITDTKPKEVWVQAITHPESNQLLLFPVIRDESSFLQILQKYVAPGSKIITGPDSFYTSVNFPHNGYEHKVNYTLNFRTNTLWSNARQQFYKFAESPKLSVFESLLCEMVWRSQKHTNVFADFFAEVKSIYTFRGPPQFTASEHPSFDTWVSAADYESSTFSLKTELRRTWVSAGDFDSSTFSVKTEQRRISPITFQSEPDVKSEPVAQSTSDDAVKRKLIGPSLPPGLQKSTDSDDMSDEGQLKMDADLSPEKPNDVDDEDKSCIGPMPSEMSHDGDSVTDVADEFEKRAKRMKDKLTIKAEAQEGPSKREEWMTELPPEMGKNFGLQNRTFSKGSGQADDKDRSIWTDTPNIKKEKEGKGKKRKRDEDKSTSVRDEQLQQQVDEYNKSKRPESLMDMHTKKQKKKKKKEKKEKKKKKERGEKEEKAVRRPFDREKDLQVNRFDDAQRKSIIKKSQLLNSRFSHSGSSSSFL